MAKNKMTEKDFHRFKVAITKKGLTMREIMKGLGLNYRYVYILIRQGNDATAFKQKLKSVYGIRI